jgi:hypothetical protein
VSADELFEEWVKVRQPELGYEVALRKAFEAGLEAAETWNRRASPWQPIETAPKDGTTILTLNDGCVRLSRWNEEKHHANPKPYWGFLGPWGTRYQREHQPTHWMPLPEPPSYH